MRLAELYTVIRGNVEIFVYHTEWEGDPIEVLYRGNYEKIPKELLKRDVMYISGAIGNRIDICII